MEWEKNMCKTHLINDVYLEFTEKKLLQLSHKIYFPIKKWAKDINRYLTKEICKWPYAHEKMFNIMSH